MPAKWISESVRRRAEIAGYTVVDAPTVLITHLGECLKKHAHELLSREDLQKMLDKLKEHAPTIVGGNQAGYDSAGGLAPAAGEFAAGIGIDRVPGKNR